MIKCCSFLLAFFFLSNCIAAQNLRGTVTDADTGRPLAGASLRLSQEAQAGPDMEQATDDKGVFLWERIVPGRYQLQVSYVGYETLSIAEVQVEAGHETVLHVQVRQQSETLKEVVVKAQSRGDADVYPLSVYTMTVEEQFRFPTTFFDPARLLMSYPGVAANNDGTNVISVRGNSPGALKWQLEGVEIVNPNHTANGGTFSDRPTQAGGGVNILSAQLLGTSNFLAGAFPAEYGNSLGGIFDMQLRPGNDQKHEFTVQAGLIGVDLAAEGPLSGGSSRASYLVNYRYSFIGLLTAMGVDFGDEKTAFQDLSFHFSFPTAKVGRFSFFGLGGKSYTLFDALADSAQIKEDKQRYDIDFQSKMGAAGLMHVLPLGKKSALRSAVLLSALKHERTADLVASLPAGTGVEADALAERKLSFSTIFTQKINARQRLKVGLQASREFSEFQSLYKAKPSPLSIDGRLNGWLLQPFLEWDLQFSPQWELTAGMHLSHLSQGAGSISPEPRLAISFSPKSHLRLSIAYARSSQMQMPQIVAFLDKSSKGKGLAGAHHLVSGYRQKLSKSLVLNVEAYWQWLFRVPVVHDAFGTFSAINLTDFSLSYLAGSLVPVGASFSADGRGRNYGLDISLQKFLLDRYYFLFAASLYRSEFTVNGNTWHRTRFDGGHVLNLTGGREFSKTKNGRMATKGISARIAWLGSFRDTPIDEESSREQGYTVYRPAEAFTLKQDDYFRIDLRLYLKWNRTGRSSMVFLDIQNALNRKNPQYSYYDSVQEKILTKTQLGLIPVLSWRMEF